MDLTSDIGNRKSDIASNHTLSIIVPIYNAAAALRRCLDAIEAHAPDTRVLLIDDASTDAAVAPMIDAFVARASSLRRAVRNAANLGFVGTVNRGFVETRDDDVLLLNSDALLTEGAVDAMVRAAASDARIATLTPFSNHATICSWPEPCVANAEPEDASEVARAARGAGAPDYPELPTAVGFCMWIRRAALRALGDFDLATFGRGYGEENDFCRRAARFGWRNALCDDAYVVHLGGQSFAETGEQPGGEQLARLLARYPDYNALVADFIARDPLRARRDAITRALRDLATPDQPR